jgi:serine/threonine protein kinase
VIDAKRIKDGISVMIKRVEANSDELAISLMLSSPQLSKDPNNYAVQILDHFGEGDGSNEAFMVMPLLRPFNDPPFSTVGEVVDFVRQMLQVNGGPTISCPSCSQVIQGINFLHDLNIAHRYTSMTYHVC